MKTRSALALLATTAASVVMPIQQASAQAAPAPTAAEVLRLVRYSQAAESQDFEGAIRDRKLGRVDIPLRLTMSEKEVRFVFFEGDKSRNKPDHILILSLLNNRYKLEEIVKGERRDLAPGRFAERVRGTDITFEDLAMRFLYWPKPKHIGVESAKGGAAWKIRCTNPVADGAYAVVDVWVSQERGFGQNERVQPRGKADQIVRSDKIQRHEGAWILRRMAVKTHSPKGKKAPTSTYLSVEPNE